MDEIIAKAHELGEKIAASDAMRRLVAAKDAYDAEVEQSCVHSDGRSPVMQNFISAFTFAIISFTFFCAEVKSV